VAADHQLNGKRVLLLFTTTGYQAAAFQEAAKKLGVGLVAGSDRCHVLEDPWRDGAIPLRFENPSASAEVVFEYNRKDPIDAVIAIGDKPTLTAALVSEALGLPGNLPAAVRACRDKFQFRELLRAARVPGPAYCRLSAQSDFPQIPAEIGFPCVLKPLCLSASRGVIRANNAEQFAAAFSRIRALLQWPDIRMMKEEAADWILVESFLEGTEVALEGILDRGVLKVLALFDKPDPLEGPYFEESIYVTPSRVPESLQAQIVRSTELAIKAVELFHGPIHAEVRVTPEGPRVLEIAARPIGGLCSRSLRFGTGVTLEELIIRHALGMSIQSLNREQEASGVMMIPVPAAGLLKEVKGEAVARQISRIEDIVISAKLQQKLVPWPEGSSYLGFIFARGPSPAEVETALRQAHSKLEFVITPALPIV